MHFCSITKLGEVKKNKTKPTKKTKNPTTHKPALTRN